MPNELRASISERTGKSADALAQPAPELDPLPPVLPPEGVTISRLAEIAQLVNGKGRKRIDVAGVRGSADAALVATLAKGNGPPVVVVAEDLDAARRLAGDVRFLLGRPAPAEQALDGTDELASDDDVLLLATAESSPFADVNPDRRAAMSRMATLGHLAKDRPFRVLVVAATALARKLVPRKVVAAHTRRVVFEDELDRDDLVRALTESGYIRVPVVEDPGSFAVRGSILDLWPPGAEGPSRVELYGDLVVALKPFDATEQTTRGEGNVKELWLPPAREAILAKAHVDRARETIAGLADKIDWPTTKTRALIEDVTTGRAFFGADAYLPAYYEGLASLDEYLPEGAPIVLASPPSITRAVREELDRAKEDASAKSTGPYFGLDTLIRGEDEILADLAGRTVVTLHGAAVLGSEEGAVTTEGEEDDRATTGLAAYEVTLSPLHLAASDHDDLTRAVKAARSGKGRTGTLGPVSRRIHHFRDSGLRVFLTARAQTQAERLSQLLTHLGVRCRVRASRFDPAWLTETRSIDDEIDAQIVVGPLGRGVTMPGEGFVVVTEEEIFGGRAHRAREKKARDNARPFIEDLRSLNVGDFIVHVEHGIGRYLGLVHKDVGGLKVDLLVVEYAGGDKLYLPVYRLNQIQKFSGGEAAEPKIDRLGGSTFAKTKARVKKEVRQMADELLRLYAERQAQPGIAIPAADDDYRAFEATFPFDETDDQARAIEEVNKDLELARPMDRLVCGDVGFGKTEVAIRAAFRMAMSGRQVAVLCPTTVLAQQHFRTFESRMGDYPITIKALSRFQSKKEQDDTLASLKEGKVDVVIGTHRLLSKDIHFKQLGLLVVDEEQRFGVTHKERIKSLRTQVDVLTLSATPIPRTLQMAVSGIRDLSLITTPPVDRRAVRTFVTRMDDLVLKEAIGRELSRGGQVFYVYNRIEGIYEKAQRVQQLFPDARIAVAHGQMAGAKTSGASKEAGETALEKTMLDFVEGRHDVLVATAIVESGLDIPRANTIVIDRADLFGLSQLYQLRGRVGRSKERAYCYLIVPPPNAMTDEARARIEALERHTELGSGFKIASLDLELRGAGDLLGAEQSGSVASVGLDLFCSMLDEAVHELRGEPVIHDVDPELSFDVTALLPDDYVSDVGIRLSLYKRLAGAIDEAQVGDIAVEMEDRFGAPPPEAKCLVRLMTLKCELRKMRVLGCEANAKSVTLHLREDTPLDPKKILDLVKAPRSPYKITPDMRLTRRFEPTREQTGDGLANCETVLGELSRCWKDG
ncbi:Transcription-repair coupling factor [Labilithrix luteola]|uniref:Transcription-repair-coupling factor n=1 Tax=Labilithrix luteola TaxID=1391654 RepID=A0A0K1PRZ3_9BACT|nr:transcription-repair coupling factor [Labilithrix luteola]AKU95894.1 Transcription-repair coupling factor [Labilithrix luteola]